MPDGSHHPSRFGVSPLYSPASDYMSYKHMPDNDSLRQQQAPKSNMSWLLVASYASDWILLIVAGIIGTLLGEITPNKRPFRLEDPDIAFPYTEHETISTATLLLCNAVAPVIVILVVALVFVPGPTVPKGTPRSLIWKRKLWELHIGWLGLALSLIAAWFITSGMKNLFGKPRPDLLARCQPDVTEDSLAKWVVGGILTATSDGRLYSAGICTSTDKAVLDDGFRSYPSGHSSSAAAGLIYLSFFLASKFSVTIPFLAAEKYSPESTATVSFPSRVHHGRSTSAAYEAVHPAASPTRGEASSQHDSAGTTKQQIAAHGSAVLAARRQAAAPPIYLLILTALPFFAAIFIASSRWYDFRHHGFDILFGFLIGTVTAWFAFRYYHLPISRGAGWAWAPRSADKAFWAGVGSYSYATTTTADWTTRPGDEEEGSVEHAPGDIELGVRQRTTNMVEQAHAGGSDSAPGNPLTDIRV